MNENPVIEFCYAGIQFIQDTVQNPDLYFQPLDIVFSSVIYKSFEKEIFLLKEILEKHNWNGKFKISPDRKKLMSDLSDFITMLSNLAKQDFVAMQTPAVQYEKESTLYCTFNQDQNCIAVATDHCIRIFTCKPFQKVFQRDGGMRIIKMYRSSSLIAVIGAGAQSHLSPRKWILIDSKSGHSILDITFKETIVNVFFSKSHLIVVLSKQISIFDLQTMKMMTTVKSTNITVGNVDFVEAIGYTLLAYPSSQPGYVVLMNVTSAQNIENLKAHNSPIELVRFSPDGKYLATCSTYGTNVNVYTINDRKLFCTFKRGNQPVTIMSMNFNASGTLLCVGSRNGTIHVYKVEKSGDYFGVSLINMMVGSEYALIKGIFAPFVCGFSEKDLVVMSHDGSLQRHKIGVTDEKNSDSLIEEVNWLKMK
jgi:WD40 repeat protein